MPPRDIDRPGQLIADPTEGVVRRALRNRKQPMVFDQRMQCYRLPASAFEPRLPQNRPNAHRFDRYLSVNVESSLLEDGLALDWGCDHLRFYAGRLTVASIATVPLTVSWEPVEPDAPDPGNPHHGAINGLVELYYEAMDRYELAIQRLARASQILSACLTASGTN